jgi:hypothetical protein
MPPTERWTRPTPEEMLEMWLHRERGPMVVDDLRALPNSPLVIAEGTTLPAWAVEEPARGVWLIPTREFQERAFAERQLPPPVTALYRLYTEVVTEEAREHGVRVLAMDGARDAASVVEEVEELFGDALAAGPHAETLDERRRLLREANLTIVEQVRGYYARPWASGEADSVVWAFACECGDRACTADLRLTVGAVAAGPALAPGHGD